MTWINLGSGTHNAEAPWVNLDQVRTDDIRPDMVVDPKDPLGGYDDESVARIYLGHVLEHVVWYHLPVFLAEVARVLEPGGELLVVGPDVYRTLERWKAGSEPWEIMEVVLEHADWVDEDRSGLAHQWNCDEARVVKALTEAGFVDVAPIPCTPEGTAGWPTTGHSEWQCAVRATKVVRSSVG